VLDRGAAVTRRKAGGRPAPRTIEVSGLGEFADWWCRARVDFRTGWLADLSSGNVERIVAALGRIILEHNFPAESGEIAETLDDVDPYDGLMHVAGELADALGKLPPR
jgi:hypothetical protein